jgi:hypothetical protein
MDKPSRRGWRPYKDPWFLSGILIGLCVVVPKIVLQYGIEWGHQGETWASLPGFVTMVVMDVGVWYYESKFVYLAMALGVAANGLLYAGIGLVLRLLTRGVRSLLIKPTP